jgi:hypothetical protein
LNESGFHITKPAKRVEGHAPSVADYNDAFERTHARDSSASTFVADPVLDQKMTPLNGDAKSVPVRDKYFSECGGR